MAISRGEWAYADFYYNQQKRMQGMQAQRIYYDEARHRCESKCKPHLKEYYEGLLDYYRVVSPEAVKKAEGNCKNLMCVIGLVHKK